MKTNHSNLSSLLFNMNDTRKRHPAKLPDAPFDSCFYILNSNLNPTPEDYRAAFLIDADVIHQTAPQFFPEFCLLSRQIFHLGDEVRVYLLRVIFSWMSDSSSRNRLCSSSCSVRTVTPVNFATSLIFIARSPPSVSKFRPLA